MNCSHCGMRMVNIAGIGFPPSYTCNNSACVSNKTRRLKCPLCKKEMEEITMGLSHFIYQCQCNFGFDPLEQQVSIDCVNCNIAPRVITTDNGYSIKCPNCETELIVEPI